MKEKIVQNLLQIGVHERLF